MSIKVSLPFSKVTKDPINSTCASNMRFNDTFMLYTYDICIHVTSEAYILQFTSSLFYDFYAVTCCSKMKCWHNYCLVKHRTLSMFFVFFTRKKKEDEKKFNYDTILNAMHMGNKKHAILNTEHWTLRRKIDEISEKQKKKTHNKDNEQENSNENSL